MNAEKYTQKALEAVKTAQNMAQENGNQLCNDRSICSMPCSIRTAD